MRSAQFLRVAAVILCALASAASADRTFTGNVSGNYTLYDEDVYFTGDVYLTGDLTITTYNGCIYTHDCNFIDGSGGNGLDGDNGYYEFQIDTYVGYQPEAGDPGESGFDLTLNAYPGEPFNSSNDIYLDTSIYLYGGNAGRGGSGDDGILANDLDVCRYFEPMGGAWGGAGGIGGTLSAHAYGDIHWGTGTNGVVDVSGGLGGSGGNGGSGGGAAYGSAVPSAPLAGAGGDGGAGGNSGGISLTAEGNLYLTDAVHIFADGQVGGRGGNGGSDGLVNGSGGEGAIGGDGGEITLRADNIAPDAGNGYVTTISARSGIGGPGGTGGDGTDEHYACGYGGCDGSELIQRGPGAVGGAAGTAGTAGTVDARVPIAAFGVMSLNGVSVDAHPSGTNSAAGDTGAAGATKNDACVESCDFGWATKVPNGGPDGTIGGSGGTIYFEAYSLWLDGCDLDARGGKGGGGGKGGEGGCADVLVCRGVDGSSGGLGGQGGNGGHIWYNVTNISGTGGIARKCSGAGGIGGLGGYPNGNGGNGNTNGSSGTIHNLSSYGTPPSVMWCLNQVGDDGSDCP